MAAIDLKLAAQLSAEGIAECLIEGAAIAGFAWLALRFARAHNAAIRFAVWLSVLLTIGFLPLLNAVWRSVSMNQVGLGGSPGGIVSVPESWAKWVFLAWAAVALFGLGRICVGLWQVHRLRRSCVDMDPRVVNELGPEVARFISDKRVRLCASDRVQAPAAIGFANPTVVIPRWLLAELSPSELRQVIIHECAHLQRCDDWTNLVQKIVAALLFFHPVVWWIDGKLTLEREMACDDAVLVRGGDPRGYAECLVRLAERSFMRRSLALVQAAVGRFRHTSLRVAQILNGQPRVRRCWRPALAVSVAVAGICAGVAFRTPVLIGFEQPAIRHQGLVYRADISRPELVHQAVLVAGSTPEPTATTQRENKIRPENKRPQLASQFKPLHPPSETPVLNAGLKSQPDAQHRAMPVTSETLVVLVSAPMPGHPIFTVQMWRITILQTSKPDFVPRKTI
jgi:beta-lactamase regulating signal transducer with metallopeptidase domain